MSLPSSPIEAVKNYNEIAEATTWKSYAIKGASGLLILSLINDIYRRTVAQGIAHMWCLGITWLLHNAIWVKDLEDLVPVLGATAERYNEEVEKLTGEIDKLNEQNKSFKQSNAEYEKINLFNKEETLKQIQHFENQRVKAQEETLKQIQYFEDQRVKAQKKYDTTIQALNLVQDKLDQAADRIDAKVKEKEPEQLTLLLKTVLLTKNFDTTQEAVQLTDRLLELLTNSAK